MSRTLVDRRRLKQIMGGLVLVFIGFVGGVYVGMTRGIPLVVRQPVWSIGIYVGDSPVKLSPPEFLVNPVLTAGDVTDVPAAFVADPFLVREGDTWYMFFEVMNTQSGRTEIAVATSEDGFHWNYRQIVLAEPFHISYPYVFKWENEYYMIPSSFRSNAVRLYKSIDFPTQWSFVGELLKGKYVDASILRFENKWYLFTCSDPHTNEDLRLYHADQLPGPWFEHPASPIVRQDAHRARPGGRMVIWEGRILRYAQDDLPRYGTQVRVFEITELTPTSYEERELGESPVLRAGENPWATMGMHNIDPQPFEGNRWIAAVDGYREVWTFSLSN